VRVDDARRGQNTLPSLAPLTSPWRHRQVVALTFALQLLHELGHVIAGLVWGCRSIASPSACSRSSARRTSAGWRLRWALNRSWRKLAGCVERESRPRPGMREALTVTALGGPLASMLGGLLLMAAGQPWQGWVPCRSASACSMRSPSPRSASSPTA
jgi:hypothetical protein